VQNEKQPLFHDGETAAFSIFLVAVPSAMFAVTAALYGFS
jgi:hypothetical protein